MRRAGSLREKALRIWDCGLRIEGRAASDEFGGCRQPRENPLQLPVELRGRERPSGGCRRNLQWSRREWRERADGFDFGVGFLCGAEFIVETADQHYRKNDRQ